MTTGCLIHPYVEGAHPLLVRVRARPDSERVDYESDISAKSLDYLSDCLCFDMPILTVGSYLSAVMAIIESHYGVRRAYISAFEHLQPLLLQPAEVKTLRIVLAPSAQHAVDVSAHFTVYSQTMNAQATTPWCCHARGQIKVGQRLPVLKRAPQLALSASGAAEVYASCYSGSTHHERCAAQGLVLGPQFSWIETVYFDHNTLLAKIRTAHENEAKGYGLHPGFIDACLQTVTAWLSATNNHAILLPSAIKKFDYDMRVNKPIWVYGRWCQSASDLSQYLFPAIDLYLLDGRGRSVVVIRGLQVDKVEQAQLSDYRGKKESIQRAALTQSPEQYVTIWQKQRRKEDDRTQANVLWAWPESCAIHPVQQKGLLAQHQALGHQGRNVIWPEACALLSHGGCSQYTDIVVLILIETEQSSFFSEYAISLVQGLYVTLQMALRHCNRYFPRLWFVTNQGQAVELEDAINPAASSALGFVKTVQREHPEYSIVTVDLDIDSDQKESLDERWMLPLLSEVTGLDSAEEIIAYRKGIRYVPRVLPQHIASQQLQYQPVPETPYKMVMRQPGHIEQMQFTSCLNNVPLKPYEVEVAVDAASLHYADVLNANDSTVSQPKPIGTDCIGRILRVGEQIKHVGVNQRVLGVLPGCLGSRAIGDGRLLVPCPESLPERHAVALPTAYLISYIALLDLAELRAGETVLVHQATGGIGLAAIALARHIGARIIATAGSEKKRAYLREEGIEEVYDSRSALFKEGVLAATEGKGVDVVLNALGDAFLLANLDSLCQGGRLVQIQNTTANREIILQQRPDLKYDRLALDELSAQDPERIGKTLSQILCHYRARNIGCLPYLAFKAAALIPAFRYLQEARHIGKVVLTDFHPPTTESLSQEGTYLITGGLGRLGKRLISHLAEQGARAFIVSTQQPLTDRKQAFISQLRIKYPLVHIRAVTLDLCDDKAMLAFADELADCTKKEQWPPLRRIYHLAGLSCDGMIEKQHWTEVLRVLEPKIDGSWHLHMLSERYREQVGDTLTDFVLFSSFTAVLGISGKGADAAANSFMDGLARYRRQLGLPALSINWGAWHDGTEAAVAEGADAEMGQLTYDEGLQMLERLMSSPPITAECAIGRFDWQQLIKRRDSLPGYLKGLVK